jgi:hypothetical protein
VCETHRLANKHSNTGTTAAPRAQFFDTAVIKRGTDICSVFNEYFRPFTTVTSGCLEDALRNVGSEKIVRHAR